MQLRICSKYAYNTKLESNIAFHYRRTRCRDQVHSRMSANDNTYVAVTRDIRVSVTPTFLDKQSNASEQRYVWAYEIEIKNEGDTTVQLRSRRWEITDGNGKQEIVQGPGVVGEQPILNPGDRFKYSSGCPLTTPSGFMVGTFRMFAGAVADETSEEFDIDVPAFALDLPNASRRLN